MHGLCRFFSSYNYIYAEKVTQVFSYSLFKETNPRGSWAVRLKYFAVGRPSPQIKKTTTVVRTSPQSQKRQRWRDHLHNVRNDSAGEIISATFKRTAVGRTSPQPKNYSGAMLVHCGNNKFFLKHEPKNVYILVHLQYLLRYSTQYQIRSIQ